MTTEIMKERFTVAYAELVDKIFRYFLFRIRGREDARELAQETFIRVWKSMVLTCPD